jgi:hypothetical protein
MVVGVQGLSLTFQNPSDFSAHVACTGSCSWTQNPSGGNSYITQPSGDVLSQTPLLMTYAAATYLNTQPNAGIDLFDGSMNNIASLNTGYLYAGDRIEMKMVGGAAYLYVNGIETGHSSALAQNPSYVAFASNTVDNIIWGSTESQYIFGNPENGYFLQKDILNPANSGFFRVNQTDPNGAPTLIESYSFASTFGKNSGTNETVTLHSPTGGTGGTYYTGTAYAGQIQWNLTEFFASSAGYGLYQTDINPQTSSPGFATSEWIPYIGSNSIRTVTQWEKPQPQP